MIVEKLRKAYKFVIWKLKEFLFWECYYALFPKPKINVAVPHDANIHKQIIKDLKKNGFRVIEYIIDLDDYKKYIKEAEYNRFSYYGGGKKRNFAEKSLEHYLAAKMLNLSKDDVYIDIANADSPVPQIYNRLYGCKVYRQDLIFPKGMHGEVIGGDATNMPIKEGFATKMALHCSFEHFEQDADIRFIKEINRTLRKGGKVCIVPLYLYNKYAIQTDPVSLPIGFASFEKDAMIYCSKGWRQRHGRFYDIHHLITRIKNNLDNLNLTIYIVKNEKEVDSSCYVKFIAVLEKNN